MTAQSIQPVAQFVYQRKTSLISQVLQWVVFAYQVIAVLIFLGGLFLANRWLQQPFIGAFYEHTLVFNGSGPDQADSAWVLYSKVEVGDQLIAVNDMPVRSSAEVRDILRGRFPGEEITATVLSTSGEAYFRDRFIFLSIPAERFTLSSLRY